MAAETTPALRHSDPTGSTLQRVRRTPYICAANDELVRTPVLTSTLKETNFVLRRDKGKGLPVLNLSAPEFLLF
jgi:hypothetical protein